MLENVPAAVDNRKNRTHLLSYFVNDAIGAIDELTDGWIVEFGDHATHEGRALQKPRGLYDAHAEPLGAYDRVSCNILDDSVKIA